MGSKRKLAAATLMLCMLTFYTSPVGRTTLVRPTTEPQLTNQDFLRFHVVANSDCAEDQALKLQVRDGLLHQVEQDLAVYTMSQAEPGEGRVELTMEQSREYIKEHLKEIEEEGQRIVRTLGYEYEVRAELGPRYIPEKTYGNVIFPAGEYEALNVTIGSGKGENWWCVLYPPLCLVGAKPVEKGTEISSAELHKTVVLESKYAPLLEAASASEPVKLQLKFKTLEWLEAAKR